jgi:hypothetical protein
LAFFGLVAPGRSVPAADLRGKFLLSHLGINESHQAAHLHGLIFYLFFCFAAQKKEEALPGSPLGCGRASESWNDKLIIIYNPAINPGNNSPE